MQASPPPGSLLCCVSPPCLHPSLTNLFSHMSLHGPRPTVSLAEAGLFPRKFPALSPHTAGPRAGPRGTAANPCEVSPGHPSHTDPQSLLTGLFLVPAIHSKRAGVGSCSNHFSGACPCQVWYLPCILPVFSNPTFTTILGENITVIISIFPEGRGEVWGVTCPFTVKWPSGTVKTES